MQGRTTPDRQLLDASAFCRQLVGADTVAAFLADHRQELFPGTPIAFSSVPPRRLEGQKLWPGVTGVTMDVDLLGTIDLAFRLQPDARNAAVVVGSAETDR